MSVFPTPHACAKFRPNPFSFQGARPENCFEEPFNSHALPTLCIGGGLTNMKQ